MLNIVLHDDLKEYLVKHNHDTIALKLIHSDFTSANINSMNPKISYEKPDSPENYDEYHIDNVTVYVDKNAEAYDNTLEFVEEKALGIHRCHVKGLKLDNLKI